MYSPSDEVLGEAAPHVPHPEVLALIAKYGLHRARLEPFDHQVAGTAHIVEQVFAALFDEMGAGKTKQTIDALCVMFTMGLITRAIIVAPASVVAVWEHPELGELVKHLWADLPVSITRFHSRSTSWLWPPEEDRKSLGITGQPQLEIIVTNYEIIRKEDHLERLLALCHKKTILVLDESSAVKNEKAKQTRACWELRKACGRVLLLNGTPISNHPGDMYSQGRMMSPSILECKTFFHFRSRYGIMGGWMGKQIVGWQRLDDLQRRFAPYVLRRLKKDCLDLPPKLPPVTLVATLKPATWELYCDMRDHLVAWLSEERVVTAPQAIVKVMRLAQITSGFLGGVEDLEPTQPDPQDAPDWMEQLAQGQATFTDVENIVKARFIPSTGPVQEVSREKLDLFYDWLDTKWEQDEFLKLLVWSRFRAEVGRLVREMRTLPKYQPWIVAAMMGGQKREERDLAFELLDPRRTPVDKPAAVVGTLGTGGKGRTMTAAHTVMNLSHDTSLEKFLQGADRVHRPTQVHPVSYYDIIAVGPKGQKTIDHHLVASRLKKENLADYTARAWVSVLRQV